jgi:Glycogen recognition site of AMP-activated protein kinase
MADAPLPFPSSDELRDPFAEEIGERLRASYAAVPEASADQVARATRAVLASAMHAPARRMGGVRPQWWWGAAAAALLVTVVARPWRPDVSRREADSAFAQGRALVLPTGSTTEETGGTVSFEFTLPSGARKVSLVGDFNGWDERATPMVRQQANGSWSARIPLAPGRHDYAFVVDGTRWVVDALAPQAPDAGYGPTNTVVVDFEALP